MSQLSCAFFGHSSHFDYSPYEDKIREHIVDLIGRGVTTFYNGFKGNFDKLCARIVKKLKSEYPNIKNVLVLSYIPNKSFELPKYFDESVYLLEKRVPFKFAITHTNRKLLETVNYVISGVARPYGGAKTACDYAERCYKTIFYVVKGYSYCDFDWAIKQHEEQMKNEEYRKQIEADCQLLYGKIAPQVEAEIANHKNKKRKRKKYH